MFTFEDCQLVICKRPIREPFNLFPYGYGSMLKLISKLYLSVSYHLKAHLKCHKWEQYMFMVMIRGCVTLRTFLKPILDEISQYMCHTDVGWCRRSGCIPIILKFCYPHRLQSLHKGCGLSPGSDAIFSNRSLCSSKGGLASPIPSLRGKACQSYFHPSTIVLMMSMWNAYVIYDATLMRVYKNSFTPFWGFLFFRCFFPYLCHSSREDTVPASRLGYHSP